MAINDTRKIVRLNVGGTQYDVSRDTLARCEGSMLASLVSKQWNEGNTNKPIFIDRNGLLFQYVLDYLRNNQLHLPSFVSRAAMVDEYLIFTESKGMSACAPPSKNTIRMHTFTSSGTRCAVGGSLWRFYHSI
jgi:hypothetical protein